MEDLPSETYDRGFQTLFEDSIYLLMTCSKESDSDLSRALARGSIVCSMMLPEVSANICIESLGLESSVFKEIDKLSPIAKFDFYLRTSFRNKKIDKGVKPVQSLQELKRLRNTYVHPKKQLVSWEDGEDETKIGTSDRTPFLDISVNPSMWYEQDAINAMRGVHNFLRHFFHDTCGYTKKKVTGILFSEDVELTSDEPAVFYYDRKIHLALERWKVDISYFRIGML